MFHYSPRLLRTEAPFAARGYRLKRYCLDLPGDNPPPPPADGTWQGLLARTLSDTNDPREHGVGFAITHRAEDGDYFLLSRWYGGNMLKHEAFRWTPASDDGGSIEPLLDSRIIACVWELEVIGFERQAWVRTAMADGGSAASLDRYLAMTFQGWV